MRRRSIRRSAPCWGADIPVEEFQGDWEVTARSQTAMSAIEVDSGYQIKRTTSCREPMRDWHPEIGTSGIAMEDWAMTLLLRMTTLANPCLLYTNHRESLPYINPSTDVMMFDSAVFENQFYSISVLARHAEAQKKTFVVLGVHG